MAIEFKINKQKAIECVLWLIQRGENDMYCIWKMMFEAEKYHLNKYGRPITGDTYNAMEYGTVPDWLYDYANQLDTKRGFVKRENTFLAERVPTRKLFSETDIEALDYGCNKYTGLSFNEVKKENHKEPAWENNWKKRGILKKVPIPFEELIEEAWLKEELEWSSRFLVI